MAMMMTRMCRRRRRRGYLRAVDFQSFYEKRHFLLYSSISVHCHIVNSLFSLPHSMLNLLVMRNSNCCEAQNVTLCSWMSTCQCKKPHLPITENQNPAGIFLTTPHNNFSSLLSHCSRASEWLPCWILIISGNKLSWYTFLTFLSATHICCVKKMKDFSRTSFSFFALLSSKPLPHTERHYPPHMQLMHTHLALFRFSDRPVNNITGWCNLIQNS